MATNVPLPVTENTEAARAFSFVPELNRECPVWPRGVAPGLPGTRLSAEAGARSEGSRPCSARPIAPTPWPAEEGRLRDRSCPGARRPRGLHAPLTSLTVTAQRPGSGTAPTAAGAQHSRQSVARSSGATAGVRRHAAAILTRKPPGLGTSERRPHLCDFAGGYRGRAPEAGPARAGAGGAAGPRERDRRSRRGRGHSGGVAGHSAGGAYGGGAKLWAAQGAGEAGRRGGGEAQAADLAGGGQAPSGEHGMEWRA